MNVSYSSYNSDINDVEISVKKVSENDGIVMYHFTFKAEEKIQPTPITLNFFVPAFGFYSQWSPLRDFERSLLPNWGKYLPEIPSSIAFGMPLQCFIGQDGKNKVCVSVSDVKTPIIIRSGICEAPGADYKVEFFSSKTGFISEYSAYIRFDLRDVFYSKSIADAVKWLDEVNHLRPSYIPEAAALPLYSSWYNFHYDLNDEVIVSECEKAYELGMRTIIIDDGWQTEEGEGYLYCGAWRLCRRKIKDMRNFTERLHQIGMKVMLWYSVPFVGKKSEYWKKFEGKFLDDPEKDYNCLDVRFHDVREYLVNTYEKALKEWDLDGFKLDFIDEFRLTAFSDTSSDKRDFESLEDAVEELLSCVTKRLKAIKPDVLLEFRQAYIGPVIKANCNMMRVGDCAFDMIKNRMGIIDLRLTSGNVAVHSDMIIWNHEDTNENVAKQLIAILFGVPQISVRLNQTSEQHIRVLRFFLQLWMKYRDVILNGELTPYNPECLYSLVEATKDDTSVTVCYSKNIVEIHSKNTVIVNGTGENYVILASKENIDVSFTVTNCLGETLETQQSNIHGTYCIELPQSAVLIVVKNG